MSNQETKNQSLIVKISFDDDIRRVKLDGPKNAYAQLLNHTLTSFQKLLDQESLSALKIVFKYVDDEGDMCSVTSDIELEEAFNIVGSNKILKLFVDVLPEKQASTSSPSNTASAITFSEPSEPVRAVSVTDVSTELTDDDANFVFLSSATSSERNTPAIELFRSENGFIPEVWIEEKQASPTQLSSAHSSPRSAPSSPKKDAFTSTDSVAQNAVESKVAETSTSTTAAAAATQTVTVETRDSETSTGTTATAAATQTVVVETRESETSTGTSTGTQTSAAQTQTKQVETETESVSSSVEEQKEQVTPTKAASIPFPTSSAGGASTSMPPNQITLPKIHSCMLTLSKVTNHICDLCRKKRSDMYRCSECDFDLCQECYSKQSEQEKEDIVNLPPSPQQIIELVDALLKDVPGETICVALSEALDLLVTQQKTIEATVSALLSNPVNEKLSTHFAVAALRPHLYLVLPKAEKKLFFLRMFLNGRVEKVKEQIPRMVESISEAVFLAKESLKDAEVHPFDIALPIAAVPMSIFADIDAGAFNEAMESDVSFRYGPAHTASFGFEASHGCQRQQFEAASTPSQEEEAKNPTGRAVHIGVVCDGCSMNPIIGARYKCKVCSDFDLCETCEAKATHDSSHPFLKFRIPKEQGRGRGWFHHGNNHHWHMAHGAHGPMHDVSSCHGDKRNKPFGTGWRGRCNQGPASVGMGPMGMGPMGMGPMGMGPMGMGPMGMGPMGPMGMGMGPARMNFKRCMRESQQQQQQQQQPEHVVPVMVPQGTLSPATGNTVPPCRHHGQQSSSSNNQEEQVQVADAVPIEVNVASPAAAPVSSLDNCLVRLAEMGFNDVAVNTQLLNKHGVSDEAIAFVVFELLSGNPVPRCRSN